MKIYPALIQCISKRFGFNTITLNIDQLLEFQPGQYLSATVDDDLVNQLPSILFIESIRENEISICSPVPQNWNAGQTVTFRGPMGHGFQIPDIARRYALIGLDAHPGRLASLLYYGTANNADMTLVGEFFSKTAITRELPAQVEMAAFDQLDDILHWADFIAIDVPLQKLSVLGNLIHNTGQELNGMNAQVLVHTSMPCAGIADCGICAVKIKNGYKLGCVDGPVFALKDLIL